MQSFSVLKQAVGIVTIGLLAVKGMANINLVLLNDYKRYGPLRVNRFLDN
jgi:hypothetical protein